MLVNEFLDIVKSNSDVPMLFEFSPGRHVQGGFHVTEIKNASYQTIDCGNSLHTWNEVVVQVWVPEEARPEDERMGAEKFLKIWDVVDSRIPLDTEAEIRIEYGDSETITSVYHVDRVSRSADGLVVEMAPPRTLCKPREILIPLNGMLAEASCCTPATQAVNPVRINEKVLPLKTLNLSVSAAEAACCTPANSESSNCC